MVQTQKRRSMTKNKPSLRKYVLGEPPAAYGGKIVLYQAPDGSVKLDVRLEHETIWLNQKQMALLFDTEQSVITKHLRNIFESGELDEKSNVQKMHIAGSDKPVAFYNLDAIISVGYRVNSKRGTQFRIWATQVLGDHLVKGYTVNVRRLEELKQTIRLVSTLADQRALSSKEASGLRRVVREYAFALDVLDDYDHGRIPQPEAATEVAKPVSHEEAGRSIAGMKERYGGGALFGQEQGQQFAGALVAIFQRAGARDAYPTIAESQRLYSTFSLRTTRSLMAISGSERHCSCAFSKRTACSTAAMADGGFRKRRWLLSPCSWRKVHRVRKKRSFG